MSKLNEFVVQSTKDYLQSIVFVDDNIYDVGGHPVGSATTNINIGQTMRPQTIDSPTDHATDSGVSETGSGDDGQAGHEATYHPRELMESFARKGVACALYEPRRGFKVEKDSEIHGLCRRADVIILDWDLHTDDGDAVCALLSLLIKEGQAQSPHQVRFCAVYTDKPNLHRILDRLRTKLLDNGCPVDVAEGKLQLISGATRISIFGKPDVTSRPPDDKEYEVEESDLADHIIREFALLHHGFLSAFALHGLAAVRRNTKRLVDKFRQGLDGPFLLDRALVLDSAEFFDELPDLLADEIRAVIVDSWPKGLDLGGLASATIDELELGDPAKPWTDMEGRPVDAKPILRSFLEGGKVAIAEHFKTCRQLEHLAKSQGFRGATPKLLADFEAMLSPGDSTHSVDLASLFCARTQYDEDTRNLHFGTIIRHKEQVDDKWNYSLCLMPICDSQRLSKDPTSFPFWSLDTNVRHGVNSRRHGIAVTDPEGVSHCLAAGGRIRDKLWLWGFHPSNGRIVATNDAGSFRFPSTDGIAEWIGELKPLHAQRIAAHLGTEASRVGLVESEWLRLFVDR